MKRPVELEQLLEELRDEKPKTSVTTVEASKLIVVVEDTEDRHEFTGEEAELLLANPKTVERLFEALSYPEEVFIELHSVVVEDEVLAALESFASTVDEM